MKGYTIASVSRTACRSDSTKRHYYSITYFGHTTSCMRDRGKNPVTDLLLKKAGRNREIYRATFSICDWGRMGGRGSDTTETGRCLLILLSQTNLSTAAGINLISNPGADTPTQGLSSSRLLSTSCQVRTPRTVSTAASLPGAVGLQQHT